MFAQYILLIFRSIEQVIVVAVGFEVVQSVRESFYQCALSREGGLGRGFLGGKFEGGGGMLQTEQECASVLEVLIYYTISPAPVGSGRGEKEGNKGGNITADVLMRS